MEETERKVPRPHARPDPDDLAVVLLATVGPGATDTERYRHAVLQVHAAAALLQQHDLPGLLQAIDRADTVGPMLDPTAWKANRGVMAEDKTALTSAHSLWLFGQRMEERRRTGAGVINQFRERAARRAVTKA